MRQLTWGLLPLAALVLAGPGYAGMIPAAVTVSPDGGNFRYQYQIDLPSDYKVKTGDFFTIYDFRGFVPGTTVQPVGWSFSSSLLGPNPPRIHPDDDGGIPNLTWTYSGDPIAGPQSLGTFTADSNFGPHMIDAEFASQDHSSLADRTVGNFTFTSGPDADSPKQTPEPATWLLLALGLPLAAAPAALRRRGR